jgi:cytochrome c oxidase subunit 2
VNTSSALDPQSPQAHVIGGVGVISTSIFLLIFVIVAGGIVYALFRFRGRDGEPDPKQISENKIVEITWTIIPFLIVLFLFGLTIRAMNLADPPPPPSPDLVVTGHRN